MPIYGSANCNSLIVAAVHSDLHAGNLLWHPETAVVTVLDAGMTTALPPDLQDAFGDFLRAMCNGDSEQLADKLIEFHDSAANPLDIDDTAFRREIAEIMQRNLGFLHSKNVSRKLIPGRCHVLCFELLTAHTSIRDRIRPRLETRSQLGLVT